MHDRHNEDVLFGSVCDNKHVFLVEFLNLCPQSVLLEIKQQVKSPGIVIAFQWALLQLPKKNKILVISFTIT